MISKNVLVIYTGGTIGMIADDKGSYQPYSNLLTAILRSQPRFDDPCADSIFSNLTNRQKYELWKGDERREGECRREQLTVHSTNQFHDSTPSGSDGSRFSANLDALQTPPTFLSGVEHTVRYAILEYTPLLDSSDVGPEQWRRIASDIELNYDAFDGFVVLHGTDTMAYTASALSFMLEGLQKSVLLTGSQIPLTHIRADASDNILHSLLLAGTVTVPEVCIYFNHQLLRGNRSTKVSTSEFDAFRSYNCPPLARVGATFDVNWTVVRNNSKSDKDAAAQEHPLTVHKTLSPEICVLRVFPGMKLHVLDAILADLIKVRRSALVLQTFGSGNIAHNEALLASLKRAADAGVVIINTSQCHSGAVSAAYANGRALAEAGVVSGKDLTCEAALTKLSYLLATNLPVGRIRELVPVSLRGEVSE